jgi:hypothetical protein
MSSAFDSFVLFVSFVVKPFCASARSTSFSSRPFVAFTQAAKVSRHQVSRHKIVKEPWFSLSACSAPSAVKASAAQGEETGGIACATHSKQRGADNYTFARELKMTAYTLGKRKNRRAKTFRFTFSP